MPYTYGDLKAELGSLLWPQGEAENLIIPHDKFFTEALVSVQRWVDCYQYNNTQLYRACSRFYQCGLNVMEAPGALVPGSIANTIRRVSVIDKIDPATGRESASAADQYCSRIYYKQVPHCEMLKYQQQVKSSQGCSTCSAGFSGLFGFPEGSCLKGNYPTPDDAEYLALGGLPLGHHYQPQVSTDSRYGRSRHGVWSLERGRIYIAPWLQSTETVLVEWDGIKGDWDDVDLVESNPELKRAVRYYTLWNHLKDYGRDDVAAAQAEKDWIVALRGLMRDCREETRVRGCEGSNARMAPATLDPIKVDEPPICENIAAPVFSPASNMIVVFPTYVGITTATTGASVYFTLDGSKPTKASLRFTVPFRIPEGTTVKAVAFLGSCPSDIVTATYRPIPSDFEVALRVLCSAIDKAGKWDGFTLNGSPDINWEFDIKLRSGVTIKRLEMYETDGQGAWTTDRSWATKRSIRGGFQSYPVVIYEAETQLNTAYTDNLNQAANALRNWKLFGDSGDSVGVPTSGAFYDLRIILSNGDEMSVTHSILCDGEPPECVVSSITNPNLADTVFDLSYGSVTLHFSFDLVLNRWIFGSHTVVAGSTFELIGPPLGSAFVAGQESGFVFILNGVIYNVCHVDPPPPPCGNITEPVFNIEPGTSVTFPTYVAIGAPGAPGATIRYTLDGSNPTASSSIYAGQFVINSDTTVKAVAFVGYCPSDVVTAIYRYDPDSGITEAKLIVFCDVVDKSGAWNDFSPNSKPDINWGLTFKLATGVTVTGLQMYEVSSSGEWNTGRVWSTKQFLSAQAGFGGAGFNSYPLVITDSGAQLNNAYTDALVNPYIMAIDADDDVTKALMLFGEEAGVASNGIFYDLRVLLSNGKKVSTVHSIICNPDPECIGNWSAWVRVPGSETACVSNLRNYTETRSFTIVSQGIGCPASPETRIRSEYCCALPVITIPFTQWPLNTAVNGECPNETYAPSTSITVAPGQLDFVMVGGVKYLPGQKGSFPNPGVYPYTAHASNGPDCITTKDSQFLFFCLEPEDSCEECSDIRNIRVESAQLEFDQILDSNGIGTFQWISVNSTVAGYNSSEPTAECPSGNNLKYWVLNVGYGGGNFIYATMISGGGDLGDTKRCPEGVYSGVHDVTSEIIYFNVSFVP